MSKTQSTSAAAADPKAIELYERLLQIGMVDNLVPEQAQNDGGFPAIAVPKKVRGEIDERKQRWEEQRAWIEEQAQVNQGYYLEQAAKTGRPWHTHPRQPHFYTEFILLTPEMAEVLLQYNPRNRTIKQESLSGYMRDIQSGCWIPTDQPIGIDTDFNLYNGQHRSTATHRSGIPTIFLFSFNNLVEARAVVDSGIKRTTTEKMEQMLPHKTLKVRTKLSAVSRSMMWGISSRGRKWTDTEIARFSNQYYDVIVWVVRHIPKVRADVQGAVAKAYLMYGEEAIAGFCDRFKTLNFNHDGDDQHHDPAKSLFKYLERAKAKGGEKGITVYRKTISAIKAEMAGKSLQNLYASQNDVFEWLEGWQIPSKESSNND